MKPSQNKNLGKFDVVLMGNSLFEQWKDLRPHYFLINNYLNQGISGQVVGEMLARFKSDVIDYQPKSVIIMGGTNDIAQNPGYASSPDGVIDTLSKMARAAVENNIKVYLCTIPPVSDIHWNLSVKNATMKVVELNKHIINLAKQHNYSLLDFHSLLRTPNNTLRPLYDSGDGVHLNENAYIEMEKLLNGCLS